MLTTEREVNAGNAVAYDMKGAASASQLSERTLHYAIKGGHLKARKLGRKIVIMQDDLKAWLNSLPSVEVRA